MYKFVCGALALMTALSCGSSSSSSTPAVGAFNVAYPTPTAVYYLGVPVEPNTPVIVGTPQSFSVSPPLPIGLNLDSATGVISGTPEGVAPSRRYTISATGLNAVGKVELNLGIVYPPRFAFVANQADSTISSYAIDLETGVLQHDGYLTAPEANAGPAELVLHTSGEYIFAINRESRTLGVYGLDALTGVVTPLSTVGQGTSPHAMVLDPTGRFLYVTSLFHPTSTLRTYEFDPGTATLTEVGDPTLTTPVIADLEIHPSGRFLSLTNRFDGIIQTFGLDGITGIPTLATTAPVNSLASSITFSNDGAYAYVTAENFNLLIRFRVDPVTGEFSDPRTKPTGISPKSVMLHPSGRFVYVVNTGSNTLTKYLINPDNGIHQQPTIVPTGFSPHSIAFDPGGNFAYVMNADSADLSVYRVDLEDGSLHIEENMRARTEPRAMVIAQGLTPVSNGAQFVYVVNEDSGDVSSFVASDETGELTSIGLSPLTGVSPKAIVADPDGHFVYVANSGSNDISSFALDSTSGSLSEIGMRIQSGAGTNGLTIDPSGRFLFAIAQNDATVSAFRIDQTTGALSLIETESASIPTPNSVAVDPTGRFLYVVGSGVASDPDSDGGVSRFLIDPRFGTLTLQPNGGVQGGTPTTISFSRSGRIAYVQLSGEQGVVAASVDHETGSLSGSVQPLGTQFSTLAMEVTPAGEFAYSAVRDSLNNTNQIDTLGLHADGEIRILASTTQGTSPVDLSVDPGGRFLYAVNQNADDVSLFSISGPTGELSLIGRTPAGLRPSCIAIVGNIK